MWNFQKFLMVNSCPNAKIQVGIAKESSSISRDPNG